MAGGRSKLVNLDAMIRRADFAINDPVDSTTYETIQTIGLRDLSSDGLISAALRKPDFQRETNHWGPDQVVSLLECFVNGDLIPSVILWKSSSYLFVIDGGHRLSVLRAWVEDDYGDGPTSTTFFGNSIPMEQRRAAAQVRTLVANHIGTLQHVQARIKAGDAVGDELRKLQTISARGLGIQWVQGNADKAEASFFKINTKGTPLDNIETLLLSNRRKPIAIAARAVIRSGKGHKYWSSFSKDAQTGVEELAAKLHLTLFEPEVSTPIKTLDLPLGGSKGIRTALEVLIDFILYANQGQSGKPARVSDQDDDESGSATVECLRRAVRLAQRITGNDGGSLGLLPAIYFYGPTGRHVSPLFLGTARLIGKKLANNDDLFFTKFTTVRERLELLLIRHKDLIATILQKTISHKRVDRYSELLDRTVTRLYDNQSVSESDLVNDSGLIGKIVVGKEAEAGSNFTDDVKSATFIKSALNSAITCPICKGYLDPTKSVSYDHIQPKSGGGKGVEENCQLTHPYCNQAVKGNSFNT